MKQLLHQQFPRWYKCLKVTDLQGNSVNLLNFYHHVVITTDPGNASSPFLISISTPRELLNQEISNSMLTRCWDTVFKVKTDSLLLRLIYSIIVGWLVGWLVETGSLYIAPAVMELCKPDWPQINRDLPASASQVLGLKACTITPRLPVALPHLSLQVG